MFGIRWKKLSAKCDLLCVIVNRIIVFCRGLRKISESSICIVEYWLRMSQFNPFALIPYKNSTRSIIYISTQLFWMIFLSIKQYLRISNNFLVLRKSECYYFEFKDRPYKHQSSYYRAVRIRSLPKNEIFQYILRECNYFKNLISVQRIHSL